MSKPSKLTAFSGVQPSGTLSIGNYLGALRRFISYQNTHNAFFCVVDQHAITVRQDPKALTENSLAVAAWYMACGLDPQKCTLFIQSHVPAHAQLAWVLNTVTQMGELERMTQFKDKAARHSQNINVGLFAYPSLMAADILLYQTHEVPVGDDQTQHIELTRDIAHRFNTAFGQTFVVPKGIIPQAGARIKDLQDPTKKMSKSDIGQGTILLTDTPAEAAKKIKRAVTDTLNQVRYDPEGQPGVSNLIGILAACKWVPIANALAKVEEEEKKFIKETAAQFEDQQYGALKTAVAEVVAAKLEELQKAYHGYMADKAGLMKILKAGADHANDVANVTLAKAYKAVGFVAA